MRRRTHAALGLMAVAAALSLVHAEARAQATTPATTSTQGAPAAASDWRGLYVGGGLPYSNVSVEVGSGCGHECDWWGDYYDYDQGDGSLGYSLHAGVRVHKFVALEVGFIDPGTINWDKDLVYMPEFNDYYNNRVDFKAKATEVSVLGILPFEPFEVYLRLGAAFWDGTSTQHLDQSFGDLVVNREVNEDGTSLLLGLGFGMTFAQAVHVRLDLQTFPIDGDVLNTREDSSLDTIQLEVQYRFGAH